MSVWFSFMYSYAMYLLRSFRMIWYCL